MTLLTIDDAVEVTAQIETMAGIDYNPKALLGLAIAVTVMLLILTVVPQQQQQQQQL